MIRKQRNISKGFISYLSLVFFCSCLCNVIIIIIIMIFKDEIDEQLSCVCVLYSHYHHHNHFHCFYPFEKTLVQSDFFLFALSFSLYDFKVFFYYPYRMVNDQLLFKFFLSVCLSKLCD